MSNSVNILYVEDNPPNIIVIERIVNSLGAHLDVAMTAREAVKMAFGKRYDMILMDIRAYTVKNELLSSE